jgi:hypothetical protein
MKGLNLQFIGACQICVLLFSCNSRQEETSVQNANPIAYDTPKDMNEVEVHFKPAAGEELFKVSCLTCHSLRYIEMQPDFPQKTWEKIVDKMIHTFGAPITDSSKKVIVDYLVEVKGKESGDRKLQ